MPQEYLFECQSCNKPIEITTKMAGMSHSCPFCGKLVSLPRLREIKSLPIKEDKSSKKADGRPQSESKSWLFSGGLLVGVLAALMGLALFSYAGSLARESTVDRQLEFGRNQLDTLPPGQLWEAWDAMTRQGLPDWEETFEVRSNKESQYYSYISYGLFGIAALGFAAMIYSLATSPMD